MSIDLKRAKTPKKSVQVWIQAGYQRFAKEGPAGLKVEVLAKEVQKSKSSFYHHFADIQIFTDQLLKYHFLQAQHIAEREQKCQHLIPDLVNILVEVKIDLLFNRQLRMHRSIPEFETVFQQTNQLVMGPFMEVWARDMDLAGKPFLADQFFELASENFYAQITEEKLNFDWLVAYFKHLKQMVQNLQR